MSNFSEVLKNSTAKESLIIDLFISRICLGDNYFCIRQKFKDELLNLADVGIVRSFKLSVASPKYYEVYFTGEFIDWVLGYDSKRSAEPKSLNLQEHISEAILEVERRLNAKIEKIEQRLSSHPYVYPHKQPPYVPQPWQQPPVIN